MLRVRDGLSNAFQVVPGKTKSTVTRCRQATMREGGSHQTVVVMMVKSQEQVTELVRQHASQGPRVDVLFVCCSRPRRGTRWCSTELHS